MKAFGCGVFAWVTLVIFNLAVGGWAVSYLLATWLNKDIAWYGDVIIGLFTAEIAVPAAIVTWLLQVFGAI